MKERTLLLTAALISGANGALRGNDVAAVQQHQLIHTEQQLLNRRMQKKDLEKLKRINAERKRANKRNKKKEDTVMDVGDEEWKSVSKNDKKKLIKQLRDEEKLQGKTNNAAGGDKKGGNGARAQVKPNQLAYLQQYFHQINNDEMEMNSSANDDDDEVGWKDLTKEEKKRVKEMMDGELAIKNQAISNSSDGVDGWKDLSKQEKKEWLKGQQQDDAEEEGEIAENSYQADTAGSEANDFVIHNRPKPGSLSVEDIMEHGSQNNDEMETNSQQANDFVSGGGEKDDEEEDMTPNSQQATDSEANDFILPMPSLTFGNDNNQDQDEDNVSNTFADGEAQIISNSESAAKPAKNEASECPHCFSFASQLNDPSIQLDSFDPASELNWSMSGQGWNTISQNCYEGTSCITSGISGTLDHQGEAVQSDLILHLDDDFDGGVLSFQVKVKDGLSMPNEAFYVSVDDQVRLSPLSFDQDWTEYSVSVGRGKHKVTWSHTYNPLELESLPAKNAGGLVMDDLRYSPFERIKNQGFEDNKDKGFIMTSGGDAIWKLDKEDKNSGSYSILASTKDIAPDSGSSNVDFVLYSEEGGVLKYKISTSTTAPHDDFAILLNGNPVDSVFGLMPSFEYESLDIPMGKVVVTLQHRKNPGNLSADVLEALGTVRTKGFTRVDDVRFEPK